ncbi:MAG: hypothetical protein KatS3mg051_0812 [Anaerolineae bacterium]|nr:MAG: hypothetical protein KatS3mg051_0812 [Anaerolineae bacterium]
MIAPRDLQPVPVVRQGRGSQHGPGEVIRRVGPLQLEEDQFLLQLRFPLGQPLQQRAVTGIGRVGRPEQVREDTQPVGRLDDGLVFGDGLLQFFGAQRQHASPVGRGEGIGACVCLRDVALDLRIVNAGVEVAQVPPHLFGTSTLLGRLCSHTCS